MVIKSIIDGGSELLSITFSNPSPIEHTINRCGVSPKNVAQKKLNGFTLKMQGKTFDNANGIPPIFL